LAAQYSRQARKPSPSGTSPVASAVFMISSREKRSGISIGSVNPISPPQSWQTSVICFRSSRSIRPINMLR
jgi:hypothetical protein